MRFRSTMGWLCVVATPLVAAASKPDETTPVKPRQYILTIEGENDVAFVPAAGLDPLKVEYRARIEYLVKTRTGQEIAAETAAAGKKKSRSKPARTAKKAKKTADDDEPPPAVASAVDVAIHAAEMDFLQDGQTVVQSRISRSRFQGRFLPDAPVLSVAYRDAAPHAPGPAQAFRCHRSLRLARQSRPGLEAAGPASGPASRAYRDIAVDSHADSHRRLVLGSADPARHGPQSNRQGNAEV